MGCSRCQGGYWECDGEDTECGGGGNQAWTTTGTVKLKIPGGGKLLVDVKARCGYNQKEDKWYPRVRLKVKGIEAPRSITSLTAEVFVGEYQQLEEQLPEKG